jgi:hypothetical protein
MTVMNAFGVSCLNDVCHPACEHRGMSFSFSLSLHCVGGAYCLIFRATVSAQADVESDALEETVSVIVKGFGYEKASFQISQLPLSQTNPKTPISTSNGPNFLKPFEISDTFPSAISLRHRPGPIQSLNV